MIHPSLRCLLVSSLLAVAASAQVSPRELNANEAFQLTAENGEALVAATLTDLPPGTPELRVIQGDDFVGWSAPLEKVSENTWQVPLDAEASHQLILASTLEIAVVNDDEAVATIEVPRDEFAPQIAVAEVAVGDVVPFFEAPEAPAAIDLPDPASADREEVVDFAADVRGWDAAMTAYLYRFAAAQSRAHALWLDLKTAGQIPWSDATLEAQSEAFKALKARSTELASQRDTMRKQAREVVSAWRAANPDANADINLSFLDVS